MNQTVNPSFEYSAPLQWTAFARDSSCAEAKDFITLVKPGVMALVVYSAFVGLLLAPGQMHPFLSLVTVFAIALGSGGAAAFNMWYDRDIDRLMTRTQKRPIPQGRIAPQDALSFAILLSLTSLFLLYLSSNLVATAILGFSIFFYSYIYTVVLKRSTAQNIVIGGAAGAFPPVIGWAAVTGELTSLVPWVLFLIIFLWTPSHFWALALYRSKDYAVAKIPMLPVTAGIQVTKVNIFLYTLALVGASFLLPYVYSTGLIYLSAAAILGAIYILLALRLFQSNRMAPSMQLFTYSIFYLFLLLSAAIVNQKLF